MKPELKPEQRPHNLSLIDESKYRWNFFELLREEFAAAERKFPLFPVRPVYMTAIVCEECGEAVKEAIDLEFEHKQYSTVQLQIELIQTAAMCYRAWLMLVAHVPPKPPHKKKS